MQQRVLIRGSGLVAAQGVGMAACWDALAGGAVLAGHHGAPLPCDDAARVTQLALVAAREAIADAGWGAAQLQDRRTALLIGSSKGPIERWIEEINGRRPRALLGVGEVAGDVGRALSMCGPRLSIAVACASGLHAVVRADLLLRTGACDRALVVGCESSLHPLFIANFERLGVLSKSLSCRPFDQRRDGFLMSEAAAAVCLERGAQGEGGAVCIESGLMLSDAHHITGVDPTGAALRYLIQRVCRGEAIDLVHAHGTGTEANDPIELDAIDDLLGPHAPAIYSHKAGLGHTQGASGVISVVLSAMMHRRGIVLPNANTNRPIGHRGVVLCRDEIPRRVGRSLVLAAGFGGSLAGVVLRSMR